MLKNRAILFLVVVLVSCNVKSDVAFLAEVTSKNMNGGQIFSYCSGQDWAHDLLGRIRRYRIDIEGDSVLGYWAVNHDTVFFIPQSFRTRNCHSVAYPIFGISWLKGTDHLIEMRGDVPAECSNRGYYYPVYFVRVRDVKEEYHETIYSILLYMNPNYEYDYGDDDERYDYDEFWLSKNYSYFLRDKESFDYIEMDFSLNRGVLLIRCQKKEGDGHLPL